MGGHRVNQRQDIRQLLRLPVAIHARVGSRQPGAGHRQNSGQRRDAGLLHTGFVRTQLACRNPCPTSQLRLAPLAPPARTPEQPACDSVVILVWHGIILSDKARARRASRWLVRAAAFRLFSGRFASSRSAFAGVVQWQNISFPS
jgi:hypothetical protein